MGYEPEAKARSLLIANLVRAFVASGHRDEAMDLRQAFDRTVAPDDGPASDDAVPPLDDHPENHPENHADDYAADHPDHPDHPDDLSDNYPEP
ncbi:hypothetical protein GCM10009839_56010 [Catenulispora yoronensis]|uniref:Uncharacterized protein n=1 Tax=Catenulispora yoronensis TaxID=450799 RepID=A0ABN2UXK4_9ACTN